MSDEIEKDKSLGKVVKKLEVELAKFKIYPVRFASTGCCEAGI